MRLRRRFLILLVDLDGLVALGGEESGVRLVECAREDGVLRLQGPRLNAALDRLELVPGAPVPEVQLPVVGLS